MHIRIIFKFILLVQCVTLVILLYDTKPAEAGCKIRWRGLKTYLKCDKGPIKKLGKEWEKIRKTPGRALRDLPRNIDRERRQIFSKIGAPGLAAAIELSQREAIAAGVFPAPQRFQRCLSGYFGRNIVNSVRYRIGGGGELSVARNSFRFGDASAVTLGHVVVFKSSAGANNIDLWAHEIQHYRQYLAWGHLGFAQKYLFSWNTVEGEARRVEREFSSWRRRNPGLCTTGGIRINRQRPNRFQTQPQYSVTCGTRFGMCRLFRPQLRRSPCACRFPNGFIARGIVP